MLLEVNELKLVIALRPPATGDNLNAFSEIVRGASIGEKIYVIAEPLDYAAWSGISGPKLSVVTWKPSAVSAVQGNVRSVLDLASRHPHSSICVCFNADDVREAILTRCGVIQVGAGISRDALPDVFIKNVSRLGGILKIGDHSYLGEHRATTLSQGRFPRGKGQLFATKGLLTTNPEIDAAIASRIKVMFLGRYFSTRDQRRDKHQFTRRLYNYKQAGPGSSLIAPVLGEGLAIVDRTETYDVFTRIPPKPNEADRVGSQLKAALEHAVDRFEADPSIRNRLDLRALKGARSWGTQKGLSYTGRAANVMNAFDARNVSGKKVLVFDDIVTSGASIVEAARALFAAGASEVQALAIGLTQNVILRDGDEGIECPECDDGYLQMRFRGSDGLAFWGCTSYFTTECTGSMRWEDGLHRFNKETRRENVIAIPDVEF